MSTQNAEPVAELIRRNWIDILDLEDASLVTNDSHFFRLGGDSSLARDLCSDLAAEGLHVSLPDILKNPTLQEFTTVVAERIINNAISKATTSMDEALSNIRPFDLVPGGSDALKDVLEEAARLCNLAGDEIEDIYPCTALQEGLVSLTQRQAGAYQSYQAFTLESEDQLGRFCEAWEAVTNACPILRTRIVQTRDRGPLQVVSRRAAPVNTLDEICNDNASLEGFLERNKHKTGGGGQVLNQPLSRLTVVRVREPGASSLLPCCIWSVHHAAYDGRSMELILQRLACAWAGQPVEPSAPFPAFLAATCAVVDDDDDDKKADIARAFWAKKLEGAAACNFPVSSRPVVAKTSAPSSPSEQSQGLKQQRFSTVKRCFSTDGWQQQGSEVTLATMMHAAWALVVAAHSGGGEEDVVYGATVSGRNAGITDNVVAPTIATIPIRVPVAGDWTLTRYLSHVQRYLADAMPFEQLGLHNMPGDAISLFRSLLVVQQHRQQLSLDVASLPPRRQLKDSSFHSYDVTVEAIPSKESVEIRIHYNLASVTLEEAQWLAQHFERTVQQLLLKATTKQQQGVEDPKVSDINLFGPQDWLAVKTWNNEGLAPKEVHKTMHHLIAERIGSQPHAPAIDAHDRKFTYTELDEMSSAVAKHLVFGMGIRRGERVLLIFEKSAWSVVAMLAAMKAGAVFVPLEWTNPVARLQQIARDSRAVAVLASPRLMDIAKQLLPVSTTPTATSSLFILDAHSAASFADDQRQQEEILPEVCPDDDAYIIFTSGSTGTPKGILVHHAAYSSSALAHGPAYHMRPSSRILQFSSYSFDAGHVEIITGLIAGACVCIPSEEDRKNDLPGVIERMRVNWFMLTPTVIMALPLERLRPFLKTAVFMAERSPQDLISRWVDTGSITVMNTYGPTECSAISYVTDPYTHETSSDNIGLPRGCLGWLVDPQDSDRLVPVGCAGELLIEGPIIARGYLDDSAKTAASFVEGFAWRPGARMYKTGDLVRLNPSDGSISFVGRKDMQIKIRGQRVEIGEIEQRIFHCLTSSSSQLDVSNNPPVLTLGRVTAVVVDYVFHRADNDRSNMVLAAFCCLPDLAEKSNLKEGSLESDTESIDGFDSNHLLVSEPEQQEAFATLRTALAAALPSYMIPTLYVPMKAMCFNTSSKLDRKRLRNILVGVPGDIYRGYALSAKTKAKDDTEADAPNSLSEHQSIMQRLWRECLQLPDWDDCSIGLQDSFFAVGGHSVMAMKLSWLCRQNGISLDVATIFSNPSLEAMTSAAEFADSTADPKNGKKDVVASDAPPRPFVMLERSTPGLEDDNAVLAELARLSGIGTDDIEDAYPCTALQEGLFALTQRKPDAYIAQHIYELGKDVSAEQFKAAFVAVIESCPILRTRLVQTEAWNLVQVVTHSFEFAQVEITQAFDTFLVQERRRSMVSGQALSRFSLVKDPNTGGGAKMFFVWQAHHAAFDGWSERLVVERLAQEYRRQLEFESSPSSLPPSPSLSNTVPFSSFVRFLSQADKSSSAEFWRSRLQGAKPLRFPRSSSAKYRMEKDDGDEFGTATRNIPSLNSSSISSPFTLATLAHTAWALVLAWHADTDDVTFGATLSGRMAPVPGMESMAGPTITTIPVHLNISHNDNSEEQSVADLLQTVQMYFAHAIPHEQFGLQRIAVALGPDGQSVCDFKTLLVVQPAAEDRQAQNVTSVASDSNGPNLHMSRYHSPVANNRFHTYDITFEAVERRDGGLDLRMHHNLACVSSQQASWLLCHFETAMTRLVSLDGATKVGQVSLFGSDDERQIQAWNAEAVIEPVDRCIHEIISETASMRPTAPAIVCAPGVPGGDLTYGQLESISTLLARHLVENCDVAVGDAILLCFEKSAWAMVAMLAVLKAGASFVPLEWSNPHDRLAQIAQGVGAQKVITSERNEKLCQQALAESKGLDVIVFSDGLVVGLQRAKGEARCRLEFCRLPRVPTEQVAYVLFTSGSTGTPKGILLPHRAYATSGTHHGAAFKMTSNSRVFHFSSYSFDMSLIETLTPLLCGACVCIPEEQSRKEDLAAAFNGLGCNWAMLTPSVVSTLAPGSLLGLEVLALAGEATPPAMVEAWSSEQTEVFIGYGPTECAAISHVGHLKSMWPSSCLIGKNVGSQSWVVNADDHDELVPVGCVGELLLEGPILGIGYLNLPERTRASFVSDLKWMGGSSSFRMAKRRVYKTGDLVYYSPEDGSLNYVGRKDTQVKIRGQRVELGEIEERSLVTLPHLLSATVEKVQWFEGQSPDSMDLAVFCCYSETSHEAGDGMTPDLSKFNSHFSIVDHQREMVQLHQTLAASLPVYMVPSIFVPMRSMPRTVSGKVDRKTLGTILMGVDKNALARYRLQSESDGEGEAVHDPPATEVEVLLHGMWASCLHMESQASFSRSDNFFKLGGNSILAMRLASLARQRGLRLTVADIFRFPVLSQMATLMKDDASLTRKQTQLNGGHNNMTNEHGDVSDDDKPFSLLDTGTEPSSRHPEAEAQALVNRLCSSVCNDLSPSQVSDIYPCTPLQEGLMALTHIQSQAYIYHHVLRVDRQFIAGQAIHACRSVIMANDILRTRLVEAVGLGDDHGGRVLQVVAKDTAPIHELHMPIEEAVAELEKRDTSQMLRRGLSKWSVVVDGTQGAGDAVFIVWTAHHAGYDGWSTPLIVDQLRIALEKAREVGVGSEYPLLTPSPPFRRFIAHVQRNLHTNVSSAAATFWKDKLHGATQCDYPPLHLASQDSPGKEDGSATKFATARKMSSICTTRGSHFTLSTILHAAWALVLATYTMTDDVTFGTVVSGRNAPVEGIERMTGPTIATIPMRVKLGDGSQCVSALLDQVRDYAVDAMAFEQMGLQTIRRISTDAARACAFRTLLVVQPLNSARSSVDKDDVLTVMPPRKMSAGRVHTYPITFECEETVDGVLLKLHHDLSSVCSKQARWILSHFEAATRSLLDHLAAGENGLQKNISEINLTGPEDLAAFLSANEQEPLETIQQCLHTAVSAMAATQPQSIAVDAWDGRLTYHDVDTQSGWLARKLLSTSDLQSEEPVLLCLQKSKWVPVCMVAILKAGAAFVPLDYTHPLDRLRSIVRDTGARRVLACEGTRAVAQGLGLDVLLVGSRLFEGAKEEENSSSSLLSSSSKVVALPSVSSDQLAWILFTSGSTGTPKGCLIEHKAFRTSVKHHGRVFNMNKASRVLHFSSYAFDVCTTEIISTLITGGCICIPSEEQRKNALAEFIRQYDVNWAYLTPSVVGILSPLEVTSLKTLVLGGERHSASLRATWEQRGVEIHNAYGPAECSVCVIIASEQGVDPSNIGVPRGCYPWVVDGDNPDVLVPYGCLGELLIEGPLLGRGYLNRPDETAARFLTDLAWMKITSLPGRIPGPAHWQPTGRVAYRTGDYVRYNMDGSMTFIGRKDDQVKVRGQRLELGDVQSYLERVFGQSYHAVALVPKSGPLQNSLVVALARASQSIATAPGVLNGEDERPNPREEGDRGFLDAVVARELAADAEVLELMDHFEECVPPFMVPSQWIPMKRIPLSPSGKSDRKEATKMVVQMTDSELAEVRSLWQQPSTSVGQPGQQQQGKLAHESLSGMEQQLWALIAETLQLPNKESVNPNASFIKLGGDSIKAMLLASRCRVAAGIRIRVGDILASRGIHQLASKAIQISPSPLQQLSNESATQQKQMPQMEDLGTEYSPSPIQDIFLALNSSSNESLQGFTQSQLVRLDDSRDLQLSLGSISRALITLADRHPLLRTKFEKSNKDPNQSGSDAVSNSNWTLKTLKTEDAIRIPLHLKAHGPICEADLKAAIEATRALIQVDDGHVMAACLVEQDSQAEDGSTTTLQKLFLVAHHLVVDFVSWQIILRDLQQLLYVGNADGLFSIPRSSFSAWSNHIHQQGSSSFHHGSSSQDRRHVERALKELTTPSFDAQDNTYASTSSISVELPFDNLEAILLDDSFFARLEPVDLILGALHASYQQTHPSREGQGDSSSLIFNESHGRFGGEGEDDHDDDDPLDWSDTVGWFTALVPSVLQPLVSMSSNQSAMLDAVMEMKKERIRSRSTRAKARLFMQLYNELKARGQVSAFGNARVIFNFVGSTGFDSASTSTSESESTIYRDSRSHHLSREPLPQSCRALDLGGAVARLGLVEVLASIQPNRHLRVRFIYNSNLSNPVQIKAWTQAFEEAMRSVLHALTPPPTSSVSHWVEQTFGPELDSLRAKYGGGIEGVLPCSPVMRHMWAVSMGGCSTLYHTRNMWRVKDGGRLDVGLLARSWSRVVKGQPMLRSIILKNQQLGSHTDRDVSCCRVVLPWSEYEKRESCGFSLIGQGLESFETAVELLQQRSHSEPFAMDAPPYRVSCCTVLDKGAYQEESDRLIAVISIDMHHVLMDAPSMAIVLDEWKAAYHHMRLSDLNTPPDSPPMLPETKIASMVTTGGANEELAPRKTLTFQSHRIDMDSGLIERVTRFAEQTGFTPSTVVQAAWALTLERMRDMLWGSQQQGRSPSAEASEYGNRKVSFDLLLTHRGQQQQDQAAIVGPLFDLYTQQVNLAAWVDNDVSLDNSLLSEIQDRTLATASSTPRVDDEEEEYDNDNENGYYDHPIGNRLSRVTTRATTSTGISSFRGSLVNIRFSAKQVMDMTNRDDDEDSDRSPGLIFENVWGEDPMNYFIVLSGSSRPGKLELRMNYYKELTADKKMVRAAEMFTQFLSRLVSRL